MNLPLKRDDKGRIMKGTPPGPGRPKGKTIKERVRDWLEEHPEDMKGFVQHFVKKNKELAWQMLEGRPAQQLGSDPDNPLIVKIDRDTAKAFNIDESDTETSDIYKE